MYNNRKKVVTTTVVIKAQSVPIQHNAFVNREISNITLNY